MPAKSTKRTKKVTKRGPNVARRRSAAKRTGRSAQRTTAPSRSGATALLPKGDSGAVIVEIAERGGDAHDKAKGQWKGVFGVTRLKASKAPRAKTGKRKGGKSGLSQPRNLADCCRAFAGAGNPARAKMLMAMLDGPATYQALCAATGLKAGPLYHHVNQLRLAGLVLPGSRDFYELTRGGRNLILTMLAVAPLIGDRRRRPA